MSVRTATGVVVMAYGTPAGPGDVLEYYTDIRRGRPPSEEQLADLVRRYAAIGGVSPLAARTAAQVAAVGGALGALAPGRYRVLHGAKHARPKIEDAIDELARRGVTRLVGLVLAPHYSALSVGEYIERAGHRAGELGIETAFVERWGADPVLVEVLAERVRAAVDGLELAPGSRLELVVSAHSLPVRILEMGDPYPDELRETAELVAARAGADRFRTGWQSAGRTPEPWLGPDILELLRDLAAEGVDAVVVCPAGFTSDHLEVLYDLDVEASRLAMNLGMRFARTPSLNDEPRVAAALARRIHDLATTTWPDP
ncbi:MAG TPA: ferrochelatase [Acidimicrobiales bacterium]|nr:ferrochelatase [Acidimicrobiales bacterium]